MKVYLIKSSSGSDYSKYKEETWGPPQNIFSAAAAMPEWVEIEMCDETIWMKANVESDADVVGIFMSTPDALRAYELADLYRKEGKKVILWGLHTMFNQEEALNYADSIFIWETEWLWEKFFTDMEEGDIKPKYKRTEEFDLAYLKPYPLDLIEPKRYNYTWSVVVTRWCPFTCSFCLVNKFFNKFKHRPIENIVEEVKALKKKWVQRVELHSDNLTANRLYALQLFKALEPLKMNFYWETTILIAKDDELLEAAKKAWVKALLFWVETPSEKALKAQGKWFVKPDKIKDYIKKVQWYWIEVWLDFLFGFDDHDTWIFDETIDFIRKIKANRTFPHLVIPFPGSETYKKLDAENRILTKDWSKYDGTDPVFEPKGMTAKELRDWMHHVREVKYSFFNYFD